MIILWNFFLVAHSSWNDVEFLPMLNSICSAFVHASLLLEKLKAFAEIEITFALIKWKLMKKSFKHVIETVFVRTAILICFTKNVGFIKKLLSALKFWFEYNSLFMGSVALICFLVFCLFYYFCIFVTSFPLRSLILHVDN